MGALEIILLAAGAVIFIASFCIPVKQEKLKEETKNLAAQEIKNMVAEEMDHVRGRLEELSEEEMQQQIEKSERSMERRSWRLMSIRIPCWMRSIRAMRKWSFFMTC